MRENIELKVGEQSPPVGFIIGLMLLVTLEVIDTTVVNIILPHLKGSFGATSDQITWSISSYMVATAIVMLSYGYLVRKFGQSEVLICGAVFLLLLQSYAEFLNSLEIMANLQGGFGAVLIPISQALLLNKFPKTKRNQIMA